MNEKLIVEFDGGSRGNPGPAAIGVVVRAQDGTALVTLGRPIGRATNNSAEYRALIAGMQEARRLGATRIEIRGDSEFVVKQMRGEYRVKHPDIIPLNQEAMKLFRSFAEASITHNYRHKNALADRLANLAMDRNAEVTEIDEQLETRERVQGERALPAGAAVACSRCGAVLKVVTPSTAPASAIGAITCQCGIKMSPTRP